MRTKKETKKEVAQEATQLKEVKKRGRKPAAKKKQAEETPAVEETAETPVVEEAAETVEQVTAEEAPAAEVAQEEKPKKTRSTRKKKAETAEPKKEEAPVEKSFEHSEPKPEKKPEQPRQEIKVQPLPQMTIRNIIDLTQAPQRAIVLSDQQIQTLTLEEIEQRHRFLEEALANVLDYDVIISDTNIWLELLVGHTSSHSDPRFNARLQFERQLEFISRLTHYRNGRFMIMGETYEEIDRFAAMQDPTNHREADWTDNIVCLNAAARLAKRLILAQQKENRLRIEGIGAESHHAAFADPAIVRKVAELFAEGKKVLLLTNDASVAIRSIGICDDLQRHNNIPDAVWDEQYAPLRPMVFTFDDLKLLDNYTRQYHYIQMAAGQPWMADIPRKMERHTVEPLTLWQDAFRPGDKHRGDNLFTEQEASKAQQKLQQGQQKQGLQKQNQQKQQQKQKQQQEQKEQKKQQEQPKAEPAPQPKQDEAKPALPEAGRDTKPEAREQEQPAEQPQKSRSRSRRRSQKQKQASQDTVPQQVTD